MNHYFRVYAVDSACFSWYGPAENTVYQIFLNSNTKNFAYCTTKDLAQQWVFFQLDFSVQVI